MKALVLSEIKDGKIKKSSLEVIHALSSQGCEVESIVFGAKLANTETLAQEVGSQGAKKLHCVQDDSLNFYQPEIFANTLAETFKSGAYQILAGSASSVVKDLFPTLAVRLNAGLAVDCTALEIKGTDIKARRPMLAGKY